MLPPPVPPHDFDHRDPEQLTQMLKWADWNAADLSRRLRMFGRSLSATTLKQARIDLQIGKEVSQNGDNTEQLAALLAYLEGRTVPKGVPPKAASSGQKYATALIGSDLHFPFHHEGAWEVFLAIAETLSPDEIILDGDVWDFAQLGKYKQNPAYKRDVQTDLDQAREGIFARVNAVAPKANKRFIPGNHELGRWQKYLWERCPEIATLRRLSMEELLGLAEMGWTYEEDGFWLTDALFIYHGRRHTNSLGGGSAQSARKEMIDFGNAGISGHTHKIGLFGRQDAREYKVWLENGCLCSWAKMQAAGVTADPTAALPADWHLACSVVRYNPGGSAYAPNLIPILEDKGRTFAIVDGEEIQA